MSSVLKPLIPDVEPTVVYHYTSLASMMKILKTQKIWATDIGYLNDVSERNLLLDTVDGHLLNFASEHRMEVEQFRISQRSQVPDGPYVASFSAESDSLNQWRSYCPQANGVSIGFKTECLKAVELAWKPAYEGYKRNVWDYILPCEFKRVFYVDPNDGELAIKVLNSAYNDALKSVQELKDNYGDEFASIDAYFRFNIEAQASFYKHKGFSSESEYRLVLPSQFQQAHQIEFRCTRSSLVPYVALNVPHSKAAEEMRPDVFRWDAVTEIKIGPTPNADLTQLAVFGFCRSIGLTSANVTKSNLPYRDW
ncbi:DUF2971 domain-containing protein [Granulicella mallensis]|uniref:DUF2971 domain-containing protein n=1 Tax=Granulicella mallensis (strain ATCC BAA-1857 / DSM 23137 / MP5ACTX8) TaxID=682795 RepID=G8NR91_GRAMM|nr:DUF2971 domain-containing protein [Granulicella mallensis]AEU36169.1 Protein of unknown function DUF2971 [Granulicella mallensis MP5ACTX8]